MAFICLSALASCAYFAAIFLENRTRDRAPSECSSISTPEEKTRMGDLNPDYRYLS